jgi:hypothetical protein
MPCANASSLSGGPTVVLLCLLSKSPRRDLAASTTQPNPAPSAAHLHPGRELSAFPCQWPYGALPLKSLASSSPAPPLPPRQYREPREKKFAAAVRVFLLRYVGTADYSTCVAGSALDVCSDGPPCQRLPKLISGTIRHCSPRSPFTSYNISLLHLLLPFILLLLDTPPCHFTPYTRRVPYHHARYYSTPTSPWPSTTCFDQVRSN